MVAGLLGSFEIYQSYISSESPENIQNQTAQIDTSDWKTYRNEEYGFEFKYPTIWKEKGTDNWSTYFVNESEWEVLQVNLNELVDIKPEYLKIFAEHEVKRNNCPGDKVIRVEEKSALYVLFCSATSEYYIYITPTKKGDDLIMFKYHDDFEQDWSEIQKIAKFDQILSTFKFIK